MLYEEEGSSKSNSRTAFHIQDISLIKQLLPEEIYNDDLQNDCPGIEDRIDLHDNEDWLIDLDFDSRSEDIEACVAAFAKEGDGVLSGDE